MEATRKLIVVEYVSLDGVIQAPGHPGEDQDGGFEHGGWTRPAMAEHPRYVGNCFRAAGAFLLGRRTYDIWAEYWPNVRDEDNDIARALNTLPKYVPSTTLKAPTWPGTKVLTGPLDEEVLALKHAPGRDIYVFGSSTLVPALMKVDLVDEYQLWLHPVVLGTGKRLFGEGVPMTSLQLIDAEATRGGLVGLTYARPGRDS